MLLLVISAGVGVFVVTTNRQERDASPGAAVVPPSPSKPATAERPKDDKPKPETAGAPKDAKTKGSPQPVTPKTAVADRRSEVVEGKPDLDLSREVNKRLEKSKRRVFPFYAKTATGGRLEVKNGTDVAWNDVVAGWHPAVGWAWSSSFAKLDDGTVFVNIGPHPVAAAGAVVGKGECVVLRTGRLDKADLADLEAEPIERWEVVDMTKGGRYSVALKDVPGGLSLFAGRPCVRVEETSKGLVATPQLDEPGHLWIVGKGGATWKGTHFPAGSVVAVGSDRQPKRADGRFRAWFQTAKAVPAYASEDAGGPAVHTFPANSRLRLLVPDSHKTGCHKVALDEKGESVAWVSAGADLELVFTERIDGEPVKP